MKKNLLLTLMLLLVTSVAFAKNGEIAGRIVDESKSGLIGAIVSIEELHKGVVTDGNGRYLISNVAPGEYEVTVSYVGYNNINKKVKVESGKTTTQNFSMDGNLVVGEVVVNGAAGVALKALNQQKTAPRVMSVISANQIGSFPDPNIGDALKRVSGIYVQYDQGEAKLVSVRGTDPSNSTFSINGAAMPSTGDDRAVAVDAIPADMVQSIEVSKTITPDMDGDAIGGAINLVTRKAPYDRMLSINLMSGYSFLTQKPQYNGSIVYGERFFNDKLGVMASASVYHQTLGSNEHKSDWSDMSVMGDDYYRPEYLNIEQTIMERLRQSYTVGLDYEFSSKHRISFTGVYNDYKDWRQRYTLKIDDLDKIGNYAHKPQFTDYEVLKKLDDYNEEIADGNTKVILDANQDGIDDNTNQQYIEFDEFNQTYYPEMERHVYSGANSKGAELTHTKILNGALNGEHQFNKLKLVWGAALVNTRSDEPDKRDLEMQAFSSGDTNEEMAKTSRVTMDFTNPSAIKFDNNFEIADDIPSIINGKPSNEVKSINNWELDGFKGEHEQSEANQQTYFADFELPIVDGKFKNTLKFGGKFKRMDKDKRCLAKVKWHPAVDPALANDPNLSADAKKNWKMVWEEYDKNTINISEKFSNSVYTVGNSVSAEWVGAQNVDYNGATSDWQIQYPYPAAVAEGYSAKEQVSSAYLMTTQNFGSKLSMIAGLRMEHTNINYEGLEYLDETDEMIPITASDKYTTLLPGVHFRYQPNERVIARLAYSRTISRPSYSALVPYQRVSLEDQEMAVGNTNLKPTLSDNFDLLGEYYFGSIGVVTGGVFYKNIKDFLTTETYIESWDNVKNGGTIATPDEFDQQYQGDLYADDREEYREYYNDAESLDFAQGEGFETTRPTNGGNSSLYGVEIGFQRQLDFLPGFLKDFSVYTNYTHNWLVNNDENVKLSGTASDIVNVSLAYENRVVSARLSYNYTSDFLVRNGKTDKDNVYCDAVNYLDANIDVYLTPKIILTASANNILGEVQREYQWKKPYTYSELSNGTRVQLGLIFNLF